jgi:hypothetical protein
MDPATLATLAQRAQDTKHGPWSKTDMLLAAAIDRIAWVIFAIYAAQGGKPDKPKPYPRPGVGASGGRPASPAAVALLSERRERNRQARIEVGAEPAEPAAEVRLNQRSAAILAARKAAKETQREGGEVP